MQNDKKITYASAKPTAELLGLFQHAEKLDVGGLARAEIYEQAKRYFVDNEDKIDFKNLSRGKKIKYVGDLPSSFKVRINDEEIDSKVNMIIRKKYNINRVMTPFKIKLVLSAYIDYLEGVEDSLNEVLSKKSYDSDSLKVEAISLILKANDKQLVSLIEIMEEESI